MSHLNRLLEQEQECRQNGNCSEYLAVAEENNQAVSENLVSANTSAFTVGLIGLVIGLLFVYVGKQKKYSIFLLSQSPKIIFAVISLLSMLIGFGVGFAVSFGACYKQSCSPIEESALVWVPVLFLLISLPIAIKFYKWKKQKPVKQTPRKQKIIQIIGFVIIIFALLWTIGVVSANITYWNSQYLNTDI